MIRDYLPCLYRVTMWLSHLASFHRIRHDDLYCDWCGLKVRGRSTKGENVL